MNDAHESQDKKQTRSTETQEKPVPEDPNKTKRSRPGEINEDALTEYTRTRKLEDEDLDEIDPNWGTARFHTRMILEIKLCGDDGATGGMTFTYKDAQEIVMGRRDPEKEVYPQINLERFDALKKGVSRRHAVITRRERGLNLTDLDSANGTYLNGQRLIAHQPRILRDGDEVRLGRLVLCIYFREVD